MNNHTRIALSLEYDGSDFHGWQRQENAISIQETLENALKQVASEEAIATVCAGRTDAGVHARCQVVHFDTQANRSERAWVYGANTVLPHSVRVLWAKPVPQSFDARRTALARHYRYIIYNHPLRPSLFRSNLSWYYKELDIELMQQAAEYWIGEHDFTSFRATSCQSRSPIRRVSKISVQAIQDFVIIDLVANAFLHHMVRNMVGVLLKIGSREAPVSWAKKVLEAKDRREAGLCASPKGLYLMGVHYPAEFGLPTTTWSGQSEAAWVAEAAQAGESTRDCIHLIHDHERFLV